MTRNSVPEKELETEVFASPELQTVPNVAVPRRFVKLRHWAPLAQLKLRWNSIQQKLAEYNWSGRYEDAKQELRHALTVTAEKLRGMSRKLAQSLNRSEKRKVKELESVLGEIETCIAELENAPTDPATLLKAQQTVRENILSKYEELSSRCVRMRRRANIWRNNILGNLRKGKLISSAFGLVRRPWMAFVDSYLSFRFFIAAFRKEL